MTGLNHEDLLTGFKSLGLKAGDTFIVHSSLKSFGYVEGGAVAVVKALLDVAGIEGTLVVPTLTGKREDSPLKPPLFDVMNTPCWTGIIPETVRKMQGVKRSLHPTHSAAAAGRRLDYITCGHEKSKSPCDECSPYYKNAAVNGCILLIGVDQERNTSIHSCEEIAGVPYHLQEAVTHVRITGYNGEEIRVSNRLHNWEKPATDFNKLDDLYRQRGIMKIGKVGDSKIRLIDAGRMFDFTIALLRKEPLFLLV